MFFMSSLVLFLVGAKQGLGYYGNLTFIYLSSENPLTFAQEQPSLESSQRLGRPYRVKTPEFCYSTPGSP